MYINAHMLSALVGAFCLGAAVTMVIMRQLSKADIARAFAYHYPQYVAPPPPPPVEEPTLYTEEDAGKLSRKLTDEDTETLRIFQEMNDPKRQEAEPTEITDLRDKVIANGHRPTTDTTAPSITGTIVENVPDDSQPEPDTDEWVWNRDLDEPDLLRDGVEVTLQKLALKNYGYVPREKALEPA